MKFECFNCDEDYGLKCIDECGYGMICKYVRFWIK